MNTRSFLPRALFLFLPVAVSAAALGYASTAAAQTYTFDADTVTPGAQDGTGVWDATTADFYNGTTDVAFPNDFATTAIFGAGAGAAGTVTVSAVNANGIIFNAPGSGNYTLTGGTITLGGTTPTITNSVASTIGSVIAGNTGLTQINLTNTVGSNDAANALTLAGTNTFTGLWVVSNSAGAGSNYGNVSVILNNTGSSTAAPTILGNLQIGTNALVTGVAAAAANQFSANSVVSFGGTGFDYFLPHASQTLAGLSSANGNAVVEVANSVDSGSNYGAVTLTLGGTTAYTFLGTIRDQENGVAGNVLSLVKGGSAIQTLTGANTYTGGTTLNSGGLSATNATTNVANTILEYGTGLITLNGGRLDFKANGSGSNQSIITGNGTTGNNVLVAASAGIDVNRNSANATNTFVLNNLSIGASTLTLTGASNYSARFDGTTTLTGNAIFDPKSGGTNLILNGAIGDGGNGYGITKGNSNAGALILSGSTSNTYTGVTTVIAGPLILAKTGGAIAVSGTSVVFQTTNTGSIAIGSSSTTTASTYDNQFNPAVVLDFTNAVFADHVILQGSNQTIGGLVGANGIVENVEGIANTFNSVLTLSPTGTNSYNYSGGLRDKGSGTSTGTLALVKTGTGTQILSASASNNANTYTGGTTVNGGTLLINNTTGSGTGTGAVTVGNGMMLTGTLGGNGSITGAVTINSGSTLSPGSAATPGTKGTLTVGALTLTSGSTLAFDITTTANKDQINIVPNGSLTLGGTLALNLPNTSSTGIDYTSTTQYIIASGVSTLTGSFSSVTGYDTTDYTAHFNLVGTNYDLSFTPVPEPSTWIGGIACLGLVGYRLVRSRRTSTSKTAMLA